MRPLFLEGEGQRARERERERERERTWWVLLHTGNSMVVCGSHPIGGRGPGCVQQPMWL
jgi:hypothetical protein